MQSHGPKDQSTWPPAGRTASRSPLGVWANPDVGRRAPAKVAALLEAVHLEESAGLVECRLASRGSCAVDVVEDASLQCSHMFVWHGFV